MSEGVKDSIIQNISGENLRARLANKDSGQWYLILDNAILDTLANKPPFFKASDWEFLLDNTPLAKMRKDGAIVAKLSPDSPWLDWFLERSSPPASLLIRSYQPFERMVDHFRHKVIATMPDTGKNVLFRFYDPRNIEVLLNSFTMDEQTLFLGPVAEMYWPTLSQDENHFCVIVNPMPHSSDSNIKSWPLSYVTLAALDYHTEPIVIQEILNSLNKRTDLKTAVRLLGRQASVKLIKQCLEQSRGEGLNSLRAYLDRVILMLRFGAYADVDPQYPWAKLTPPGETAAEKWDRIAAMADECYEEMYEIKYDSSARALRRLWLIKYDHLAVRRSSEQMESLLATIWPERYKSFDPDGVRRIIEQSRLDSIEYGLAQPHGSAILAVLYYLCGIRAMESGIRYPWLAAILAELAAMPPEKRARHLFHKLRKRLNFLYRHYRLTAQEEKERRRRIERRHIWRAIRDLKAEELAVPSDIRQAEKLIRRLSPRHCRRLSMPRFEGLLHDSWRYATVVAEKTQLPEARAVISFGLFMGWSAMLRYDREVHESSEILAEAQVISETVPKGERAEFILQGFRRMADQAVSRDRRYWYDDICDDQIRKEMGSNGM